MRSEFTESTTQDKSYYDLLNALIPKSGAPLHKWKEEHFQATLKNALKNGSELEPIYGVNHFLAHEALLRPEDKDGKKYSIARISQLFYDEGLAIEFDTVSSSLGLKAAKNKPVTLNVSVDTVLTPSFFDAIQTRMQRLGLNPQDVIFEILEHDVNPDANIKHLERLQYQGFRFALDDFLLSKNDKTISKESRNRIAAFGEIASYVKIDGPLVRAYFEQQFTTENRYGKEKTYSEEDFEDTLHYIQDQLPHTEVIAERVYNINEANILFTMGISGVQGWDLKARDFHYTPQAQNQKDISLDA